MSLKATSKPFPCFASAARSAAFASCTFNFSSAFSRVILAMASASELSRTDIKHATSNGTERFDVFLELRNQLLSSKGTFFKGLHNLLQIKIKFIQIPDEVEANFKSTLVLNTEVQNVKKTECLQHSSPTSRLRAVHRMERKSSLALPTRSSQPPSRSPLLCKVRHFIIAC